MARVIEAGALAEPTDVIKCRCGHCNSLIEYERRELDWISDHPPFRGLDCPSCGKKIFHNGSRW